MDIRAQLDLAASQLAHSPTHEDQQPRVDCRLSGFEPASEDEVARIIKNSPSTYSPHDPIPTWLLKKHLEDIVPYVTLVVNRSLESGFFPSSFKKAIVKPLLKKPSLDPDHFQNYRPVSNLKFLSKVLERVVASRLQDHLDRHSLTEPLQSAYRKHHGTESALIKVHNDILLSLDSKHAVFLVLLDLSAAFDTIDNDLLIHRFCTLGVEGSALSWIMSYLCHRKQSVRVNDSFSPEQELLYGVPQGSVLGPLFFTVYNTPLAEIARLHDVNVHLYADDIQLYTSFNLSDPDSEVMAKRKLESCIADMRRWMIINRLKLNDDKSEFIVVASQRQCSKIQCNSIQIGDVEVQAVSNVRNLGVQFDSTMSMSSHINATCRSVYYHIRNISSIRKSLSKEVAAAVIHSYVISRLDYGNSLLYNAPVTQLAKLQKAQNAAARVLTGIPRFSHITPILKELHWLPVKERIMYKILLMTWKALNGRSPQYILDLVSLYVPNRNLRSSNCNMLSVPKVQSLAGEKSFFYSAPKLWNSLPVSVRNATSIESFKIGIKTFLFKSAFH